MRIRKTAFLSLLFIFFFAAASFAETVTGQVKNVRPEKKTIYLETENGTVHVKYNEKTKWPVKFTDPPGLKGAFIKVQMAENGEAVKVNRV